MRDLHTYLINPFDNGNLSMTCLLAFATDHLQRMMATTPALFTARIAATNGALAAVSNSFTDDETKLGLRKARKLAKDTYRAALPKSVGKLAVAVEAKFGEGSPEFKECFPHGRSVFGNCPDDKLGNELQTTLNGLQNHGAALGGTVVSDATALLVSWNAVYTPSEAATGAKVNTVAAKNAARQGLQLELFKNLLTIALNFPEQPAQLDVYMQPSLLEPHTQSPAAPTPTPAPGP